MLLVRKTVIIRQNEWPNVIVHRNEKEPIECAVIKVTVVSGVVSSKLLYSNVFSFKNAKTYEDIKKEMDDENIKASKAKEVGS